MQTKQTSWILFLTGSGRFNTVKYTARTEYCKFNIKANEHSSIKLYSSDNEFWAGVRFLHSLQVCENEAKDFVEMCEHLHSNLVLHTFPNNLLAFYVILFNTFR